MNLLGSYDQDKVVFQFKDIDNKLKENKTINSSDSVLEKFIINIKFPGSNICPCRPGEIILTTGIHGLSKLGFLMQNKINFDNKFSLNERLIIKSIEHFCRPRVYPNFLNNLLKTRSNKKIRRLGCTDSSDGLFQAIQDLAIASNCKAIINYEKIPKDKDWPKGDKWDEYYFFGGEDYELVFSLPKKWAKNLTKLDKNIKEIGYFANGGPSIEFKDKNKNQLLKNTPFKHF